MHKNITGIILSGGKSTRMGQNKSFLKLGEHTIIESVISLMNSLFPRVLLITNEPQLYKNFNVEIFEDVYSYKGPLAGIHSGLLHSNTNENFIISCDMPLVREDIINFIIDYPSDKSIKITRADGFVQQLCGFYSKDCLPVIERSFSENDNEEIHHKEQRKRKCKVLSLVNEMNGEIIDIEEEYVNYRPDSFLNMNRPEEYQKILNLYNKFYRLSR